MIVRNEQNKIVYLNTPKYQRSQRVQKLSETNRSSTQQKNSETKFEAILNFEHQVETKGF